MRTLTLLALCLALAVPQNVAAEERRAPDHAIPEAVTPLPGLDAAILLDAPQDLIPFAEKAGADTLLISPEEQAKLNERATALFFGPWTQSRPSIKAKEFLAGLPRKVRGFNLDVPWDKASWAAMLANADEQKYPTPRGPGIVTRHTDLRSVPSDLYLHLEATPVPAQDFFDFFQVASLPLGTPVYVSHVSRDQRWLYVEYPQLGGWVRADDISLVSKDFIKAYQTGYYAAVVRERVMLTAQTGTSTNGTDIGMVHIGGIFPYADAPGTGDAETAHPANPAILVPVRNADGMASIERVTPEVGAVQPRPQPLTPMNLALLANQMLGQPYAWGGSYQRRDCSLATRDLFAPFGLWLPRNSRPQSRSGDFVDMEKMSPEARHSRILRDGKPFITLLGFTGHVGLYIGKHNGEAVMWHTIMGLRTNNPDEFYRRVVGRCVISTLEPGKDIPEMQLRQTLLERLNSMRVLP